MIPTESNRRVFLAAGLLICGILTSRSHAQPPPPLPVSVSQNANDGDAAEEPNVRRIYIPAEELSVLLERDQAGVLLTRDEFRRLYRAAQEEETSQVDPSSRVVTSSATYEGQIRDHLLSLTATVRFTQFARGWQVLRVPLQGLRLQSATLDGEPAAVARDGEDRQLLLVFTNTAGEHQLTLELAADVKAVGSDGLVQFGTLGAPSGVLTLRVPEGKSVLREGLRQPPREGSTYRIPLGGRDRVTLRVTDSNLRETADALLFASTAYGLNVAPGEVSWMTRTSMQVFGQRLSEVTFSVPAELEVASVESAGLEEWTLEETRRGRGQLIRLRYRQPVEGERGITIRGLLAIDSEEWTVPNLVLQQADSQAASIVVQHDPKIRLQSFLGGEVRPVSGTEQPGTLRFSAMDPEFDLEFRTLPKEQSVHVAMTNLLSVSDDGLDLHTIMDVVTHSLPLFDVQVSLPADFELLSAHSGEAPVNWSLGRGTAGILEVRVPLDPPLMPGESRRLEILSHADPEDWPIERDPVLLPLPEVRLPQADVVEGRYGIIADPDLEVRTVDLTGLDPARPEDLQALRQAALAIGKRLRLGFNYQDTRFSGQLEVSRQETHLAVSTLSVSRLAPQTVQTRLRAFVTVTGGGTRGLLIRLPDSAGTDLRFEVQPAGNTVASSAPHRPVPASRRVSIVEQSASDPVNGLRTWALQFDTRMHGDHILDVTLVEARPDDEAVVLPGVTFVGAERQNGWVAVVARQDQDLQVVAEDDRGRPLPRVDPVELPNLDHADGKQRIVAGFRYLDPDYSVRVEESVLDAVPLPTAVADRLDVTSAISVTGRMHHQLDATFRTSGMQSLRFVLPRGADLWAVLIDQTPLEVRRSGPAYQVPLARLGDAATEHTLRIVYRSQDPVSDLAGRLRLARPRLAALDGSGTVQPVQLLRQSWTLRYPRDMALTDSQGQFSPVDHLAEDRWLIHSIGYFNWPTMEQAGWRIAIPATIILLLTFVAALDRRFGHLVTVLIVLGIPLLAFGALVVLSLSVGGKAASDVAFEPNLEGRTAPATARPSAEADFAQQGLGMAAGELADQPVDSEPALPPAMKAEFESEDAEEATQGDPLGQTPVPQATEAPLALPKARGALLSLPLDLEAPSTARSQEFTTLAPTEPEGRADLDVSYVSRSLREVLVLILASGAALMMWLMRHSTRSLRVLVVFIVLVLPLGLAPILPPLMAMIAEGLLLGGLAGLLLWLLFAAVRVCADLLRRCCGGRFHRPSQAAITGLLVLEAILWSVPVRAADSESAQESTQTTDSGNVPTVFVPYDNDPLAADRVYLPMPLFAEWSQKADPGLVLQPQLKLDGVVSQADYSVALPEPDSQNGSADETRATVRGQFVVWSFREESVWIPLPVGDIAISSADLDGKPAVLRPGEGQQPELLLTSAGRHQLELEFAVSARRQPNSGELTVPLRPVAAGMLRVSLPPTDQPLTARVIAENGERVPARLLETQGRNLLEIPVQQGGRLNIQWQPESRSGATDHIVHVTSRTAVQLTDQGVDLIAEFEMQVRQGVLAQIPFRFPETVRIKGVTGPDVGGWEIAGTGDERKLTIFLRRSVEDQTRITVRMFVPLDDRSEEYTVGVPSFAPLDVTRETGTVTVLAGDHLQLQAAEVVELRQIDTGEATLPEALEDSGLTTRMAYRFTSRPWTLALEVGPQPPRATATAQHGILVGSRKTTYSSRFRFELSGTPRRTLTIALTDDFLLTRVAGDQIEDWYVEEAELIVDFGQPRTGAAEIVLEGHTARDPEDDAAVLITPLPLELDRQESVLGVWIAPVYSATLDNFDTWRTIDRAELPSELKALRGEEAQFAFRSYAAEPEIINLDLIPQRPQIIADAVTLIAVSDVSVDFGLTLRWSIERAATDTLVFTVPDWLENQLEIRGEGIRQTTQTLSDDGRVRWRVELAEAVRGEYLVSAIATLPPAEDDTIRAPEVIFEHPATARDSEFPVVDAQQSFVIPVNLSRGRLVPDSEIDRFEISRTQLPFVLQPDLIARAMAIYRHPVGEELAWISQLAAEQEIQAAQVTMAEHTSVIAADGSVTTRSDYRVRNRGQQFLALKLSDSLRVLSVLVRETPVRCLSAQIGEQPVTLIPLPQTGAADLSFLVRVISQEAASEGRRLDERVWGDDLDLSVPIVVSPLESRDYGVPVVHTLWTVHLPENLHVNVLEGAVNGAPRTNMTHQSAFAARTLAELQLYRELEDLSRLVISKDVSKAQRLKGLSNVKVLQRRLETLPDSHYFSDRSSSFSPQERELVEQKSKLRTETFEKALQAQQFERDEEGFRFGSAIESNTAGREFVFGNNAQILADNYSKDSVRGEPQEGFRSPTLADGRRSGDRAAQGAAGKPTDLRSELRGRLSSQLPLQRGQMASGTVVQQQEMGGMGGGGGFAASGMEPPSRRFSDGEAQVPQQMMDFGEFAEGDSVALVPGLDALGLPADPEKSIGLSLPIELPVEGQTMTFSKVGGEPRLALSVRPRQAVNTVLSWVWAIVVVVGGAWLLLQMTQRASVRTSATGLAILLASVGLLALLFLPPVVGVVGGVLLVAGCTIGLLKWHQQSLTA